MGLDIDPETPVIGMVTRLTDQKGMDLVERVIEDIMGLDVGMVVLGAGDSRFEGLLRWASWRYQGKFGSFVGYSDELARNIYAGSDIFLMPSLFEPCGISQMIALRYGAVPLVRETGGLRDTVIPYNKFTDEGNGFSFENYNAGDMLFTLKLALRYYADKPLWRRLTERAMRSDCSWENSAKEYLALYADLTRARGRSAPEEPAPVKKRKAVKKTSEKGAQTAKKNKAPEESREEPGPEPK